MTPTAILTAAPARPIRTGAHAAAHAATFLRSAVRTPSAAQDAAYGTTVHVWTGKLEVGSGSTVLTALLGSCVGIGILWRGRGLAALAHCLLPDGRAVETHAARYVTTAVPALLAALGVQRAQYGEIEVVLAGGARMLRAACTAEDGIGRRNIAAAQAELVARGLRASVEDVGGCHGRRMSIDCARQSLVVVRVAGETAGHA